MGTITYYTLTSEKIATSLNNISMPWQSSEIPTNNTRQGRTQGGVLGVQTPPETFGFCNKNVILTN